MQDLRDKIAECLTARMGVHRTQIHLRLKPGYIMRHHPDLHGQFAFITTGNRGRALADYAVIIEKWVELGFPPYRDVVEATGFSKYDVSSATSLYFGIPPEQGEIMVLKSKV